MAPSRLRSIDPHRPREADRANPAREPVAKTERAPGLDARPASRPPATPAPDPPQGSPPPAPRARAWPRRAAWLVVPAALCAAAAAWWTWPLTVDIALPTRGPAVQAVYATGAVEASVAIPLSARNGGRLVSLHANEGDRVRRGLVLARVEATDLAHAADELHARELLARSQHARTRALAARQFVSPAEVDRTSRELQAARSAAARARALRDDTLVRAPADGTVLRRDGEPGQVVAAGQAIYSLACCAPLRVTADVDEEDIALVHRGQKVAMKTDDLPGRVFDGSVVEITPQGDPVSRSYRVRIHFDAPAAVDGGLLRPGMTVDTNLIVDVRDAALLVPNRALQGRDTWVVEDGRARRRTLALGLAGSERAEVVSG